MWKEKLKLNIPYFLGFLIITISVLIDLGNGFVQMVKGMDLSLGILYRGLLFFVLLSLSIKTYKKLHLLMYTMFALLFCSLIVWLFNEKFFSLSAEIKYFVKITFFIVIITYYDINESNISTNFLLRQVVFFGIIAASSIIFSFLTGLGIESFGDYAFGVKSFFKAQNDIGLSLILCLTISLYYYISSRKLIYFVCSVVISVGSILLGTRAGIAGSIIVWASMFLGLVFFRFRSSKIPSCFRLAIIAIGFILIAFAANIAYNIVSQSNYMQRKFTLEALSGGSNRSNLINAGIKSIEGSNLTSCIFGQGYYDFHKTVNYYVNGNYSEVRMVEVDYIDILGSYGLLLGGVILVFPLFILGKSILNFMNKMSLINYSLIIGVTLYCGHSFYAGHAIVSPTVATIASVYFYKVLSANKNEKR